MFGFRAILILAVAVVFSACETQSFAPEQAPEFVIISDFSPFYKTGPLQARGPDATLRVDERVKVLRREMGYSLVQLEDERTGYIANENMAVAPPRPPAASSGSDNDSSQRSGGRKRGSSSPRFRGEQVNDTPLPDPIAPPDLNIAPEEVPSVGPASTPPPEKPKYRF
jgi:hypothetical protein